MEIQKFEKWIKIQKLDQIKYLAPVCTFRSYVLYSTSTTLTFWGHFMKVCGPHYYTNVMKIPSGSIYENNPKIKSNGFF